MSQRPDSFFEIIGGHAAFEQLVDVFYREVAADEYLIAMYPDGHHLEGAKKRLRLFLEQYFGGPTTYSQERGHPRLRMRHAPFPVTPKAREHWLAHMRVALDSLDLPPLHATMIWDYFERAATAMINTFDEPGQAADGAAAGASSTGGTADGAAAGGTAVGGPPAGNGRKDLGLQARNGGQDQGLQAD